MTIFPFSHNVAEANETSEIHQTACILAYTIDLFGKNLVKEVVKAKRRGIIEQWANLEQISCKTSEPLLPFSNHFALRIKQAGWTS